MPFIPKGMVIVMKLSDRFVSATVQRCTRTHHVPAPYMRRSFVLDALPVRAALSVSGLGFYELYVNGTHITHGKLCPYIANSNQILPYDAYDILPYLTKGKNTIAFLLGNGMQNAIGGYVWKFDTAPFTSAPKLAFALELGEGEDAVLIEADEEVKVHPSPILFDDLRMGEIYDARLAIDGWNSPSFDDSAWQSAIPAALPAGEPLLIDVHPIKEQREIKAVNIWQEGESFIYDFGENISGLTRLSVKAEAGRTITVDHGEKLDENGLFTQYNITFHEGREPEFLQRTTYIAKGEGREEYLPHFTYYGFRYAKVTGVSKEEATEELLTYVVMYTDLKTRGGFVCSDETVNKLQEMTRRADVANFWHFPTDCPQREKNGWTADAALSAEQLLLNFDPEDNYTEWMRSIIRAMDIRGALPGIVPTGGWGFEWGNGPAWDCVLVYLPYFNYILRGDLRASRVGANAFMRYLAYLNTRKSPNGLLQIGLGDWLPAAETAPLVFTDSVIAKDIADKMAILFHAMGMELEADYAKAFSRAMRSAIREHLCEKESMTFSGGFMSAQAMALFYGICDTEEEEKLAFARLLEAIEKADGHMTGGVLGGRVIFRVLADHGEVDLALRMITRKDAPSYGYMIDEGMTALGEALIDHQMGASLNHHFWGDISAFFMEYLAGIRLNPTLGDLSEVFIAPLFPESLSFAEGFHIAPMGEIRSRWEKNGDGSITLSITLPASMHGAILLPAGYALADGQNAYRAVSGNYRIIKTK